MMESMKQAKQGSQPKQSRQSRSAYPIIDVSLAQKDPASTSDTSAFFLFEGNESAFTISDNNMEADAKAALKAANFTGKKDQQQSIVLPSGKKLIFIGLGEKAKANLNMFRLAAAKAVAVANSLSSAEVAMPSKFPGFLQVEILAAEAEGAILAPYRFDVHKSERPGFSVAKVIISDIPDTSVHEHSLSVARIMAEQALKARHLVNTPPQQATPKYMADAAVSIGRAYRMSITVMNRKELQSRGMNGIISVCQGSVHDPVMVVLEYGREYAKKGKTYCLVGKGVCFDAGGLDIKSASGMETMKMDKAGAITVLSTIEAAARLKLPIHLYAIMPFVENMPSGSSYKPGDIIKAANGKTIEVLNTDAEGRIILADALHYATLLKPDGIIDLATLTGAVSVALGNNIAAVMGNSKAKDMIDGSLKAGQKTWERVWQLPMDDDFAELIASDHADIKNTMSNAPGNPAGTIQGAKFLENFVGDVPWAHLDIAGTAWSDRDSGYLSKGATGAGVRLLTQFLMDEVSK